MTATFHVGDAIEVMGKLPEKSVDLILTSPPFLALRSYLPADHPDKALEGGSQATPGEYVDWLLDVVEACERVLAPHGSLCFELGDTYSGSGGAGGDYNEDGLRDGQPIYKGSNARKEHRVVLADGRSIQSAGISNGLPRKGKDWPQAKSLSLIPESFRWAMVYGHNPFTGRTTAPWRLRNVIRWVRPNPPVGALGDKFRPATSELMVFCKAKDRYFDLDSVRSVVDSPKITPRSGSPKVQQGQESGALGQSGVYVSMVNRTYNKDGGAPPLDWWNIPPGGYPGSHYAVWPPELLIKPIKAMCPSVVCLECGPIHEVRTLPESGSTEEQAVLLEDVRVGVRPVHTGSIEGVHDSSGIHHGQWDEGSSDGNRGGLHLPTSPSHGRTSRPDVATDRSGPSQERDQERQPDREFGSNGQGRALSPRNDRTGSTDTALSSLRGTTDLIRNCPRCGGTTRPGRVLDPFGGSGTTALVATGHGRDCILIDLDERNYDLALDRVGPFILTRAS